jgi:hypothetical protein
VRDYTTLQSDTDWSQGTWETIQHYTQTQIEVKEQLVVKKNMDVTEHERLYNITLRHPYSFLLQAVPLLQSVSECNVV